MDRMTARKTPSATRPPAKIDPYHELEPIPQPDVQEKSSDTVWALWSEVKQHEQKRYADTAPMTKPGEKAAVPVRPPAAVVASGRDRLAEEVRRNNRVCPKMEQWHKLDALLRAKSTGGAASLPKPLSAPEMQHMPSLAKRTMFRGLVDWAGANNLTEDMLQFVRALPEDQWHHLGE